METHIPAKSERRVHYRKKSAINERTAPSGELQN